jgi:hypothetical protein
MSTHFGISSGDVLGTEWGLDTWKSKHLWLYLLESAVMELRRLEYFGAVAEEASFVSVSVVEHAPLLVTE